MTQPHQHPERCETCENAIDKQVDIWYTCRETMFCGIGCNHSPEDTCQFSPSRYKSRTSHSSATEPYCDGNCAIEPWERHAIAQAEREKVLDEALAEFQNINAPPVRVTYIRHVLESLRQQEEP